MDEIRIGVWGGPGSGKTTFLASLRIAALLEESGEWSICGQDSLYPGSTKFLADVTNTLRKGEFPAATTTSFEYAYEVTGRVTPGILRDMPGTALQMLGIGRQVSFILHLYDTPGGYFASITDPNNALWEKLANCDGLIYLFDLSKEQREYSNFEYMQIAADFIKQKTARNRYIDKKYLPHFLAACLSKVDDPAILKALIQAGLVIQNEHDRRDTPYLADTRQAFEAIGDPLIDKTLSRYFHNRRLNHFACSSIGFYAQADGRIDLGDCVNLVTTPAGSRIRSGRNIHPVNVFAPLIWIEQEVYRIRKPVRK
jgi:hypothetical protein